MFEFLSEGKALFVDREDDVVLMVLNNNQWKIRNLQGTTVDNLKLNMTMTNKTNKIVSRDDTYYTISDGNVISFSI